MTADDEDLVRFNGTSFDLFFHGSAAGVSSDLDLDGAQYLTTNGHLLLSFDGSGSVGGLAVNHEDVLECAPATETWELSYRPSEQIAGWA